MGVTELLENFFRAVSADAFFLGCFAALFTAWCICFFVALFKSGYGLKRRGWYFMLAAALCALLKARADLTGESDFSAVFAFFAIAGGIPVILIPVKTPVSDDNARAFVRFLDEGIKRSERPAKDTPVSDRFSVPEILSASPAPPPAPLVPETKINAGGLDFSHVKNVLKRLDPALLSYADRKQIHELELALYDSERGFTTEENRTRINEGLGNLLKIMARHGI